MVGAVTTRRTEYPAGREAAGPDPGRALIPGGSVGGGRYRLLAKYGADKRTGAQFWRGRDNQLHRDVALTLLVGPFREDSAVSDARRALERAAHAARLTHPGNARVLDVLTPGRGIQGGEGLLSVVVSDWSEGTDLVELVAEGPLPPAIAARLLEPLAKAVDLAHHSGVVLGVDHPCRVRVTPEAALRLVFPGPLPQATLREDVRGLGAILYLLLTGHWPLPEGPQGIPAAPMGADGQVVAPRALFGYIPHELSAAVVGCLTDEALGGIRTSAALIQVLERVRVSEDETQRIDAVEGAQPYVEGGTVWTTRPPSNDREKRRKLAIGVTALAVATVGVLAWLGTQLIGFFADDSGVGGPTITAPAPGGGGTGDQSAPPPPQPGEPIRPAGVQVYNVKGTPDNPRRASMSVDDNAGTGWRTDTYKQPFPSLKPGVGIMASFAEPVAFAEVVVDSPSDGTVVEIRSAPGDSPKLEETKLIGRAELRPGRTQLQLDGAEPTQHLLVWITTLGEGNVTELTEIGFVRAR